MFLMNVKVTEEIQKKRSQKKEESANGRREGGGGEHFIAKEEKTESVTIGRRPIHQLKRRKNFFLSAEVV